MDSAWILGILAGLLGGGFILLFARWLERCEGCGSLFGPRAISKGHEKNALQYTVEWQCRKCGHRWEATHDYILY